MQNAAFMQYSLEMRVKANASVAVFQKYIFSFRRQRYVRAKEQ